jgi:O-antigen/teichoic acid export membrane protein
MALRTVKNVLLLSSASVANVAMTALQSLVLGHLLDVDMFGVTRTATAYMIFLTMLGHFTLHNALAASIVKASKKNEASSYIAHAAILVLSISLIVSAGACAIIGLSNFWTDPLRWPLIIVISSLPVVCLTILLNACLEALGEYKTYMQVIFLTGLIPLLLLIPFAWAYGLTGWLIGKVLSSVILLAVAASAIKHYLKLSRIDFHYFRELMAFSRIQIFSGVLSLVLLSADVILLEAITHDLKAVANYGAALLFYSACAIIPTSIGRVYFKQVAPTALEPGKKQREFLLITFAVGLLSSVLLFILGPFAIGLFFSRGYEDAQHVIRLMSTGLTFNFMWNSISTINIATGMPKNSVAVSLGGSVIGLAGLAILIPMYQACGAAISMALAYTIGVVIGLALLRKKALSTGAVYAS